MLGLGLAHVLEGHLVIRIEVILLHDFLHKELIVLIQLRAVVGQLAFLLQHNHEDFGEGCSAEGEVS